MSLPPHSATWVQATRLLLGSSRHRAWPSLCPHWSRHVLHRCLKDRKPDRVSGHFRPVLASCDSQNDTCTAAQGLSVTLLHSLGPAVDPRPAPTCGLCPVLSCPGLHQGSQVTQLCSRASLSPMAPPPSLNILAPHLSGSPSFPTASPAGLAWVASRDRAQAWAAAAPTAEMPRCRAGPGGRGWERSLGLTSIPSVSCGGRSPSAQRPGLYLSPDF